MHIAVDLDDVVLDFFPGVTRSIALEFGVAIPHDSVMQSWDKSHLIHHSPHWGKSGYKSWWDWLRDREWLWAQFGAVPGAIGGVKALRAAGHYVELLTSKPEWAEHNVWKWLGKWRPPFNRVTIVNSGQPKETATEADVLIDDSPKNVEAWAKSDPQRLAIMFDRFGNGPELSEDLRIARVADWVGVLRTIEMEEMFGDVGVGA